MRIVLIMKYLRAVAAALLLLPLAACSDAGASGGGVVTSVYPLQFLTEAIAGDRVRVTDLTRPGQEPHDVELSLEQTALLSEADMVIFLPGFQPAVDEAVVDQEPGHLLEVTDHVDLLPLDGHAHGDEEAEEEGHAHEGEHDPHFWLDPVRMTTMAKAIEGSLAEVYPEHADAFAAHLDALLAELDALRSDYRAGLGTCERDTVVVSHDAFGYLADYGLDFQPIAGISPGAEPSPARLAELADLIEQTGVTTVFTETLASPEMAETLAAELDVQTAVLDPIEGLNEGTDDDYLSLMRANLDALRDANGCR
jgi:zinc transport system substrate-binding protein